MKKNKGHLIAAVEAGSAAEELEIEAGDRLLSVNGREVEDVFDYRTAIASDVVTLLILKPDGEEWEYEIENGGEDPGLVFENGLMSEYRSCTNSCIFCFIDQMPKGMRDTLYFKDDDSRLSFLQGNYITLTNMKDADIRHIIRYRLEPINISVHTTNPELRVKMLHNRFAGEKLKYLKTLYDAGIEMNGQIVLCRGYNDREELARTLRDLLEYAPLMQSVSVVPVGLTDFRECLCPLEPVSREDARETVRIVEEIQKEAYGRYGIHFAHASDELYLTAELPLPEADRYDGYLQFENGVGMITSEREDFYLEYNSLLDEYQRDDNHKPVKITCATGKLAYSLIAELSKRMEEFLPNLTIEVVPIRNDFFGELITVTGLITAKDLMNQLKGKDLGNSLCIHECMLRSGEEVFLDDITLSEVMSTLQVPVDIVKSNGGFLSKILEIYEREG